MSQLDICMGIDPRYRPGYCHTCSGSDKANGKFREWTWCPWILNCRYSKIPAALLPIAVFEGKPFEREVRWPEEKSNRIYYAVLSRTHSQALAMRAHNVFASMGIFSVEKLRSMPPEFFEALPKVKKVGSKMLDAVTAICEEG